jgi:alkylated DNA repair dioxygenase AlkB
VHSRYQTADLFAANPRMLERLPLPDAEIYFQHGFQDTHFCADALARLQQQTAWRHEQISLFGKRHWQPRLVAAHGDTGLSYTYSGLTLPMQAWTPLLLQIKSAIEDATGASFNSVLLNFYRDQHDSMGWHSDDENTLGTNPAIASISFGATRIFKLKHRYRLDLKTESLPLADGTLLLMSGPTQHNWKHAVDKMRRPSAARINLTFRRILLPP